MVTKTNFFEYIRKMQNKSKSCVYNAKRAAEVMKILQL